jgi:predicted short-subunit dehydrogenase-like oxidoreductase (DUF2520 family)
MTKIVIVGTGRIAWHLGKRLRAKGLAITQVIGRTAANAAALAEVVRAEWTDDYAAIVPDADWVLVAVRDDAIAEVGELLAPHTSGSLITHTSGGTPGAVLAPHFERYGVFYPLQSFSREHTPVWSKIPFCVDASTPEDVLFLKRIAKTIGNLVYRVDDDQRAVLHVGAVFANNFANHCFAIAERLLEAKELPFELLHPLMEETLAKALQDSPTRMQTGPAIRGDRDTVERHLALLAQHPAWRELYERLSQSINPDL